MNKLILSMVLFVAVMNPIQIMAKQFLVTNKGSAQEALNMIRDRKFTTIDVIALDNDKYGYVKIIYE